MDSPIKTGLIIPMISNSLIGLIDRVLQIVYYCLTNHWDDFQTKNVKKTALTFCILPSALNLFMITIYTIFHSEEILTPIVKLKHFLWYIFSSELVYPIGVHRAFKTKYSYNADNPIITMRLVNAIHRGARLKKFYLLSAPSGMGKSRSMVANTCYIGANRIYDDAFGWISNGTAEPVLYITTELELSEVQTMMLAFLSGVNEAHIIYNRYEEGELDRVKYAAKKIKTSPLHIKRLPDFSLQDIENAIKFGIHEWGIRYVFNPIEG